MQPNSCLHILYYKQKHHSQSSDILKNEIKEIPEIFYNQYINNVEKIFS